MPLNLLIRGGKVKERLATWVSWSCITWCPSPVLLWYNLITLFNHFVLCVSLDRWCNQVVLSKCINTCVQMFKRVPSWSHDNSVNASYWDHCYCYSLLAIYSLTNKFVHILKNEKKRPHENKTCWIMYRLPHLICGKELML